VTETERETEGETERIAIIACAYTLMIGTL
jgi:hypothetical protein